MSEKEVKDGFMLVYCKDGKAHNVVISEEQQKTLQNFIPVIFQEKEIKVFEETIGIVEYIGKDYHHHD